MHVKVAAISNLLISSPDIILPDSILTYLFSVSHTRRKMAALSSNEKPTVCKDEESPEAVLKTPKENLTPEEEAVSGSQILLLAGSEADRDSVVICKEPSRRVEHA